MERAPWGSRAQGLEIRHETGVLGWVLFALVIAALAGLVLLVASVIKPRVCVQSHVETQLDYALLAATGVPLFHDVRVCDRWKETAQ